MNVSFFQTMADLSCNNCKYVATRADNLRRHMTTCNRKKTKEFTVKGGKFVCNNCDKSYSSQGSWANHHKAHHVNISFICLLCNAEFTRNSSLIHHQLACTSSSATITSSAAHEKMDKLPHHHQPPSPPPPPTKIWIQLPHHGRPQLQ